MLFLLKDWRNGLISLQKQLKEHYFFELFIYICEHGPYSYFIQSRKQEEAQIVN